MDKATLPSLAGTRYLSGGVFGIIFHVLLLLRFGFRINPEQEAETRIAREQRKGVDPVERNEHPRQNSNLEGWPSAIFRDGRKSAWWFRASNG